MYVILVVCVVAEVSFVSLLVPKMPLSFVELRLLHTEFIACPPFPRAASNGDVVVAVGGGEAVSGGGADPFLLSPPSLSPPSSFSSSPRCAPTELDSLSDVGSDVDDAVDGGVPDLVLPPAHAPAPARAPSRRWSRGSLRGGGDAVGVVGAGVDVVDALVDPDVGADVFPLELALVAVRNVRAGLVVVPPRYHLRRSRRLSGLPPVAVDDPPPRRRRLR